MAKRLFEEVSANIRSSIASGILRPGDKLPSERDLAEDLKVGRPVIREALRSLEEAGILEFRRGVAGGAFIRTGDSASLTRSMNDLIFLGAITIADLIEARGCVLRFTAERAAERGTEEDFDLLEQIVEQTAAEFDQLPTDFEKTALVAKFYEVLGKAAHNDVLIVLIRSLSQIVIQIMAKTGPSLLDMVLESRRRLIQHLRNRDPHAAGAEVADHLAALHPIIVERVGNIHTLELSPFTPYLKS